MPAQPTTGPGSIAVVILNHNGRQHLDPCLRAALALDGLPGPAAVVVADNGSDDGSVEHVRAAYPGVRVLPWGDNLGFAAGNDRAAEIVEAEHVLFLNNDTRITSDALRHLRKAVQDGTACAGARLVSWDGRRLDFDGGGASFTGHGHAAGHGQPVGSAPAGEPRDTLFASGAAMLVERAVFLQVGGFDAGYFAYYEDVDFGWRLWLAGHRVVHVPAAVVHHRHHGTSGRWPAGVRARLFERNALATVAKNYAPEHLPRLLAAALALAAVRAGAPRGVIDAAAQDQAGLRPGVGGGIDGGRAVRGAAASEPVADGLPLPDPDWPGWPFLAPLDLDWPALARARAAVQALRRRADADVLPRLGQPYAPVPATPEAWAALVAAVDRFDLAPVLGPVPSPSAARPGLARWRALRRGWALLRGGGPGPLAAEIRRYRAWKRLGGR